MQHVNTLASLPNGRLAVVNGGQTGPLHLPSSNGEWHGPNRVRLIATWESIQALGELAQ